MPTILHYFNPRNGPIVLTWYVTVVALWVASAYWLFFQHGAEALIAHPGLLTRPGTKPWMVKTHFLLCLAGGIVGLGAMIFLPPGVPGNRGPEPPGPFPDVAVIHSQAMRNSTAAVGAGEGAKTL